MAKHPEERYDYDELIEALDAGPHLPPQSLFRSSTSPTRVDASRSWMGRGPPRWPKVSSPASPPRTRTTVGHPPPARRSCPRPPGGPAPIPLFHLPEDDEPPVSPAPATRHRSSIPRGRGSCVRPARPDARAVHHRRRPAHPRDIGRAGGARIPFARTRDPPRPGDRGQRGTEPADSPAEGRAGDSSGRDPDGLDRADGPGSAERARDRLRPRGRGRFVPDWVRRIPDRLDGPFVTVRRVRRPTPPTRCRPPSGVRRERGDGRDRR